jgi:hypothetical protein
LLQLNTKVYPSSTKKTHHSNYYREQSVQILPTSSTIPVEWLTETALHSIVIVLSGRWNGRKWDEHIKEYYQLYSYSNE